MQPSTFKTPFVLTKLKSNSECLRYIWLQKYRHCMLVGDFWLCLTPEKVWKVDGYIDVAVLV